jgi:drug/metabolite transporter (DMT)-like permease
MRVARPPAVALMAIAAGSWGISTITSKVALDQLAPLDLLGLELFVGASLMVGGLALTRRLRWPSRWRIFALLGLAEPLLSYALFDFGLNRTGAIDGALLLASEGLFTVMLAVIALHEMLSARLGSAVIIGFAGSALLTITAGSGHGSVFGDLLVLAASFMAAVYAVGARRFAGATDALGARAVQLAAAAALSTPVWIGFAAAGQSHLGHVDAGHLLAALATGVLSTILPFVLYNLAIRTITASHAAIVLNTIPLVGAVGAIVALGEQPAWTQLIGGGLVLAAVAVIERAGVTS